MEVIVAKNAGFCFGVKRAIEKATEILNKSQKKVYSIGALIHNEVVTNDLKSKGLIEINDVDEIKKLKSETVIIRTHGIEKNLYDILKANDNEIIDLTCPFVKKIHNVVEKCTKAGYKIIVIGDKNHPEVKGIVSYGKDIYVVSNESEIKSLPLDKNDKIFLVFQTTADADKSQKLVDILQDFYYNIEVSNTICNTTIDRQEEVKSLAKVLDIALIVGSVSSSNTMKLYNISKEFCPNTYIVSSREDLKDIPIDSNKKIGVFAGASTPQYLIGEILTNVRDEF